MVRRAPYRVRSGPNLLWATVPAMVWQATQPAVPKKKLLTVGGKAGGVGGRGLEGGSPTLEIGQRFDDGTEPHEGMSAAAELSALTVEDACLFGREGLKPGGGTRQGVHLSRELGHPEGVDHIRRLEGDAHLPADREVHLVSGNKGPAVWAQALILDLPHHWWAVTLMWRASGSGSRYCWARTITEGTVMTTRIAAGMTVQTISSPVWPWVWEADPARPSPEPDHDVEHGRQYAGAYQAGHDH